MNCIIHQRINCNLCDSSIIRFFTEHKLVFEVDKDNKKCLCEISTIAGVTC